MSLREMLEAMEGRGRTANNGNDAMSHERQIEILRGVVRDYANPTKWKVGDLVQPRADASVRGHGQPHIVVERLAEPFRHWNQAGSNHNGDLYTVRIANVDQDGDVSVHWVEDWVLEAFDVNDPKGVLKG